MGFQSEYARLNDAQKRAVDIIDGPLLVIAGPGTGKTQLLSARVANILANTDAAPNNILALTFTESGAANMRERLARFIGQDAYGVSIATYHAFGGDLIARYPEYFEGRLDGVVDTLTRHQIVSDIVDGLAYDDPLKQTRYHLGDLVATISETKQALLQPADLREIARQNDAFYAAAAPLLAEVFNGVSRMPSVLAKSQALFGRLEDGIAELAQPGPSPEWIGSLATLALQSLRTSLDEAETTGKTKPLSGWASANLAKDREGNYIFDGALSNRRLASLAGVIERYDTALAERGLYDFDDMILRSIAALEQNDDLRFTLQERYQYILLDEYQDTNAAQSRIVELLTDNPVNEGRPNVMAVGDDDQAIYAFQGAQYSNMADFYARYRGCALVNLTENYRSTAPILQAAESVAAQIGSRLTANFPGLDKSLTANSRAATTIERLDYRSPQAERAAITKLIKEMIDDGADPAGIAVLAKRHATLEELAVHLLDAGIPVAYERRDNILDTAVIRDVLAMAELVVALAGPVRDAAYWPAVLSQPAWGVPIADIYALNWAARDERRDGGAGRWAERMLESRDDDGKLRKIALFFLAVAARSGEESGERVLDWLVGSVPIETGDPDDPLLTSPLQEYYRTKDEPRLYDLISHLSVLRHRLRAYKGDEGVMTIGGMLALITAYQAAGERMLDTSPYVTGARSVQLMTVYKAKGLEFDTVILPSTIDGSWRSRGASNRLTLPPNLAPIRYKGDGDDETLRLFFVALTRARTRLILTAATGDYAAAKSVRLKFLDEYADDDGIVRAHVLPNAYQTVSDADTGLPDAETLALDWRPAHELDTSGALAERLRERLGQYQVSPTHVTGFIDLEYGGPAAFYLKTLLGFESAPSPDSEYGNAIHETLDWLARETVRSGTQPPRDAALARFDERIDAKTLSEADHRTLKERGRLALSAYLAARPGLFTASVRSEVNFRNEGVFIGDAHLAGKIDRLEIDDTARTITVIDYKTGKPAGRYSDNVPKLHKYRLQVYCYKLLVERSRTYKGYTVTGGRLEFIEPDGDGQIHAIGFEFDDALVAQAEALITAVYRHVMALDFPDTASYGDDAAAIRRFEADLIDGTV